MWKPAKRKELLSAIRAALDCPSHFGKPTITLDKSDKAEGFRYGDTAIVLCSQCVERLRKALGLKDGESVPTDFRYFGGS